MFVFSYTSRVFPAVARVDDDSLDTQAELTDYAGLRLGRWRRDRGFFGIDIDDDPERFGEMPDTVVGRIEIQVHHDTHS